MSSALRELETALKCTQESSFITHFKEWECSLPALAVSLYNKIFENYTSEHFETVTTGFLKYLFLLVSSYSFYFFTYPYIL